MIVMRGSECPRLRPSERARPIGGLVGIKQIDLIERDHLGLSASARSAWRVRRGSSGSGGGVRSCRREGRCR